MTEERTARFETRHADPETAATIAAALRPDNTPEIRTEVEGAMVRTHIARDRTGGLQSSADDYLVNLAVAAKLVANARGDAVDALADAGDARYGTGANDGRDERDGRGADTNKDTHDTTNARDTTDTQDTHDTP